MDLYEPSVDVPQESGDEYNIYNPDTVEEMLYNDELDAYEEGFMQGYLGEV